MWWWMSEAVAKSWHSPDVSFQPRQVGTFAVHSNTVESDGWPPPQQKLPPMADHTRRLVQDRTHIVNYCSRTNVALSILSQDFLYCMISLERCCFFHVNWQKKKRWVRERARWVEGKDFFFLTRKTSIQIKSHYLLGLCGIVTLNGILRRRDSSREHIVGW